MTSYFIQEDSGELLYYGEVRQQEDEDEEPIREGKGILFNTSTGRLIEGWFKNDLPYGYRRQINGNLQYSVGYSEQKLREGFGRYYFPSGAKQIAVYRKDLAEGFGIYRYPSSECYQGMYVADKRDGYGILIKPNGSQDRGFWKKGSLVGKYIHINPNGDVNEEDGS